MQVAVLTHKMRIKFNYALLDYHKITPSIIADEVDMVGFSAELIETIIDNSTKLREENVESDCEIEDGTTIDTLNVIRNVTL